MARISVIGAGYVGLVTSACLAELGNYITVIEKSQARVASLLKGQLPLHEPGLDSMVQKYVASGHLRFTDDYASAIPEAEFAFIAVNTPPKADGSANNSFVFESVRQVSEHAPPGLVIVVKSTVPVGTGDAVAQSLKEAGRNVSVISSPEFLRQGSAIEDFLHPDRILIGSADPDAADRVAALYCDIDAPILRCGRRSAEMAKYAANAFLATRISFINEIADICDGLQANIDDVVSAIGSDKRIGPTYLNSGVGWGGSCLPKDILALCAQAHNSGQQAPLIATSFVANQRQRQVAYERIVTMLNGNPAPVVGVLGLAFKPETDDLREAPSIDIIRRLMSKGMTIRVHDPVAMNNARSVLPEVCYCEDSYGVAQGADLIFLATEWSQYLNLDWTRMRSLMRGNLVLDGRNVLDRAAVLGAGFVYESFGRNDYSKPQGGGDFQTMPLSTSGNEAVARLVREHSWR